MDGLGNVYIADTMHRKTFKLNVGDAPSLTFADTTINSPSVAQDVTVLNAGNATLSITGITFPTYFNLQGANTTCTTGSQTLAAQVSCVLGIEFLPTTAGSHSGNVVLTDDALNAANSTQNVAVQGTGVDPMSAQTITFPNPGAQTYGVSPLTLTATADSGLAVTYGVTAGSAWIGGSTLTITGAGDVTVQATQAGNAAYYAATPVSVTFTVNKALASVTPNALNKTYGDADPTLTGTLTGFVAADHVTATYTRVAGETVAGSPYTISATLSESRPSYRFPGGVLTNYTITYNTANFSINAKTATWTTNAASKIYGASDPNPLTTGSGAGFLVADGVYASYSRATGDTVAGGPYAITATLSPAGVLGNYSITNAGAGFAISQSTSASAVSSSAASVLVQNNVTFTATVNAATNRTPTGTVTFMDGTTPLGTAPLSPANPLAVTGPTARGAVTASSASLTLSTLAVGTHSITAVFAGDANITGSTSPAITQTVQDFNFAITSGDGTIVANASTVISATVNRGNTAIYTVQVAPSGATFLTTVTLTLTGLPAGATYTITPSTLPAGSGTTTVTVTVTTANVSLVQAAPKDGMGFPKPMLLALLLPLFGLRKVRRTLHAHMKSSLLLVVLFMALLLGLTARSSGSGVLTRAPQTYPMSLTATSGALHHSVTLNLTIQ